MGKVRNLINIIFDTEPVYGGEYIKAKKKIHWNKVNTNFQGKKYQNKILHVNVCH